MVLRRQVVLATAATATTLGACSASDRAQQIARSQRQPGVASSLEAAARLHELVRYATLAPSSHNTQCWQFHLQEKSIQIRPDLSRRCPAVDPDDHHLFVSLGCATENLVQAARALGLHAEAEFAVQGAGAIAVQLDARKPIASPLFQAISERQCTRGDYDGQALATDELRLLEQAGTGNGVHVRLLTGRPAIEQVADYVRVGNTAQMQDPAFMRELKDWLRFGADEAIRTGDGLSAALSGNPSMPRWLGRPMMDLFFTPKSENERYTRQIRNAAGIAVFISEVNDKPHWVEAGRCYERFALQATALGIRNAMLNQPVEVAAIRQQFAAWLGLSPNGPRPDLVVRFGRGPTMPMSLRRPVESVLR